MPATTVWNTPQFWQMDEEIIDPGKLLIMNGKKLSSKASNSTTFLTAYTLKSFITQTALDKSDGLYAIPRWRSFCSRCLGLFFFLSEEFLTTKKLL